MTTPIEEYGAPSSEFSEEFVVGMRKRMAVSFHKYGKVEDAFGKVDEIDSLITRLKRYQDDGNTEWLMDVANFAMIEWMQPAHPDAHYRPTDSDESPGRTVRRSSIAGGKEWQTSSKSNLDVKT